VRRAGSSLEETSCPATRPCRVCCSGSTVAPSPAQVPARDQLSAPRLRLSGSESPATARPAESTAVRCEGTRWWDALRLPARAPDDAALSRPHGKSNKATSGAKAVVQASSCGDGWLPGETTLAEGLVATGGAPGSKPRLRAEVTWQLSRGDTGLGQPSPADGFGLGCLWRLIPDCNVLRWEKRAVLLHARGCLLPLPSLLNSGSSKATKNAVFQHF